MQLTKYSVFYTALLLLLWSTAIICAPTIGHTVVGEVSYPGGGHPPAATFAYTAYITVRPGETQSESSPGNTYTESTGVYTTNMSNFTTGWSIGETFHIDVTDGWGGSGTGEVELTSEAYDTLDITVLGSSLPVQLSGFIAESAAEGIKLVWTTESEVDNAGYYIYRAETKDGMYQEISGFIHGAGNTSDQTEYEFIDTFTESGQTYYYRLDELDIHGNLTTIAFISATLDYQAPVSFHIVGNYPNPFNAGTVIAYVLPEPGFVEVAVYDLSGRHVRTLMNDMADAGQQTINWDGNDPSGASVANGVYVAVVKYQNQVRKQRLMMVK